MKEFADQLGLNSLAAKTDLAKLKTLGDHQTILHLSAEDHYVVLGNIGDDYIRLIDLDNNNFYYRRSIEHFKSVWDNTALILSNKALTENDGFARIDDSLLSDIVGAASCQECNTKIQDPNEHSCEPSTWPCRGYHEEIIERWGCASSATATEPCYESDIPGSLKETCVSDSNDNCVGDGSHIVGYTISACK
jgi:hypothetical protein